MSSDPSAAAVIERDPEVIVRWILVNGVRPVDPDRIRGPFDLSDISTGRGEEAQEPMTISVSPNTEGIAVDSESGQTALHGGGKGVWQNRAGIVLVGCWAGSIDDFESRDIRADPQDVREDMKNEVIRSVSPYYQGTTNPETGNQELESLAPAGVQEIPTQDIPPQYGYQVGVQYRYTRFSPSRESFSE